jgi:hypothetical protein
LSSDQKPRHAEFAFSFEALSQMMPRMEYARVRQADRMALVFVHEALHRRAVSCAVNAELTGRTTWPLLPALVVKLSNTGLLCVAVTPQKTGFASGDFLTCLP